MNKSFLNLCFERYVQLNPRVIQTGIIFCSFLLSITHSFLFTLALFVLYFSMYLLFSSYGWCFVSLIYIYMWSNIWYFIRMYVCNNYIHAYKVMYTMCKNIKNSQNTVFIKIFGKWNKFLVNFTKIVSSLHNQKNSVVS